MSASSSELEISELKAKLAMAQGKCRGLEERQQKTARQNAWLIVLLAAAPASRHELIAKMREEDPSLADTLEDPRAADAFRATLRLGE